MYLNWVLFIIQEFDLKYFCFVLIQILSWDQENHTITKWQQWWKLNSWANGMVIYFIIYLFIYLNKEPRIYMRWSLQFSWIDDYLLSSLQSMYKTAYRIYLYLSRIFGYFATLLDPPLSRVLNFATFVISTQICEIKKKIMKLYWWWFLLNY